MRHPCNKFNPIAHILCLLLLFGSISCVKQAAVHETEAKSTEEEQKPKAAEWFVSTDDREASLYIKSVGAGDTVIVLHGGFGNDHTGVNKVANGLENKFNFIFYDQRGSSLSYCKREAISVENHVKDLETLRKSLGLEQFTLVSHSAGTVLALLYLEQHPERVKNLVLLGAMDPKNGNREYFTDEEWATFDIKNKEYAEFKKRPEIQAEIEKAGLDIPEKNAMQRQQYNTIKYYAAANLYNIEKWDELNLPHWNPIAASAASQSFDWDYDFTEVLTNFKKPVTVINGEYDYVVGGRGSPVWKSVIANNAPNINLMIIEKASHLSWVDDPETFRSYFEQALEKGQVE